MTSLSDLATRLGPAVVGIAGGGSGVVVAPGRVVTLARNVDGDAADLHAAERRLRARVVGRDAAVDVALLAVDELGDVDPLAWAPDPVGIGTPIAALADPAGRGLRVTGGTVSSAPRGVRGPRGRLIEGVLEHTAPLPRGSGGGALVDTDGRLLGLHAVRRPGGFILAWPASAVRRAVEALSSGAHRPPRQLGVAVAPPGVARRLRAAVGLPPEDGVLVHGVRDGSPAARAGLTRGDLIVAAGGRDVVGLDDLYTALDGLADGTLPITVVRGTERRELTAELAS